MLHSGVCTRARSRKWFTRLICIPGRKREKKASHRLNTLSGVRTSPRCRLYEWSCALSATENIMADINPLTILVYTRRRPEATKRPIDDLLIRGTLSNVPLQAHARANSYFSPRICSQRIFRPRNNPFRLECVHA